MNWPPKWPKVALSISELEDVGYKRRDDIQSRTLAKGDTYVIDFKHPVTGADCGSIALVGTGGGGFIPMVRPIPEDNDG